MLFDRFSGRSGKHRVSLVRTGGVSLLAGAILAASVGTWSVLAGKDESKAAPAAGTLTKTARDATTGSTTTTSAGSTVNYTLEVSNRSGENATVNVTDAIGANQQYVAGSLKVPDGWPKNWSTDGGQTWTTTEPASGVTNIRVGDVPDVGDYGQGRSVTAALPVTSAVTPAGFGDGWEPIFWQDRVYNIPHHRQQGVVAGLQCFMKFSGDPCPGFDNKTTYVSSTSGAAFNTGTDDLNSAYVPFAMVDQSAGRFWYPAGRGDLSTANPNGSVQIGMACVDMAAGQACGFTRLATLPRPISISVTSSNANPRINGGAIVGTRYYSYDDNGNVYCFDRATSAACSGYPIASLSGVSDLPAAVTTSQGMLRSWDGRRVYGVISVDTTATAPVQVYGVCVDTQTGANCSGYPVTISSAVRVYGRGPSPALDSTGQVVGFCVPLYLNPTQGGDLRSRGWRCYGPTGQSITVPSYGVPFSGDQNLVGGYNNNSSLLLDGRVYLANGIGGSSGTYPGGEPYTTINVGQVGTYVCYDPATDGPCPGFTPYSSGEPTRPYTITQDPYLPDCLWELGDAGRYEVFDKDTGKPGCNSAEGRVTADPGTDLCDPTKPNVQAWRDVRLTGLTPDQYREASVTLLDVNGNEVAGYVDRGFDADGRLLISGIPVSGTTTELTAVVRIEGIDPSAVAAGTKPIVQIDWVGPPPQICYQVTVDEACTGTIDAVNNDAVATFAIANGQQATATAKASLTVSGGAECPPISLDKRIVDEPEPVPGSPDTYTISYDVLVTYPTSPLPTTYDLSDQIKFGASVTVTSATIRNAVPGTLTARPDWNGTSQPIVATDVPIASNTTHTWVVTAQFKVDTTTAPPASLDCVLAGGETGTGTLNVATVTSRGQTLTDEDCATLGALTIDKTIVSTTPTGAGTWKIEYDVTVRNPSTQDTPYDLDDKLMFGTGVTVNSATVANTTPGGITTSPTWNGTTDTRVVTNQTLAASGSHVYRVTANATIASTITTAASDCTLAGTETGTGFFNRATLTVFGVQQTDDACDTPTDIGIVKVVASAEPTGPTTWRVTYNINVTNRTAKQTSYDLDDVLAYGAGMTINDASVSNVVPGTITTSPTWNGSTDIRIVTGQAISANGVHVYQVDVDVTVPTSVTTTAGDCSLTTGESGTGFLNRATVTADGTSTTAEDCDSPTSPAVTIAKALTGANRVSGNDWQVTYDITVTETGHRATSYDLDDQLMFGAGITVTSASVSNVVPGTITTDPSWNGTSAVRVVTGQAIAADATHTYRVTANATVPTTLTTTQGDCELTTGESGTGFLNRATLTADGSSRVVDDCGSPSTPPVSMTKTLVSATQAAGNGPWTVSYDITAVNSGQSPTTYDLDDELLFGDGVTVTSATVRNTAPGSITTNTAWNGTTTTRVVTGEPIAAAETQVYRVTATATVATTITATAGDCTLATSESGTGFLNRATMVVDGTTTVDDACATPNKADVTIDKNLVSSTNTSGPAWTVVYDVTVRNTGTASTDYDLDDRIMFGTGIAVTSASVVNTAPGGITTSPSWNGVSDIRVVTGQTIAASATHVYRVTVGANVPSTVTAAQGDCTMADGESGTGFLNRATVTADGAAQSDEDCATPNTPAVAIDKRVSSATNTAGNNWTVTYTVTVTNSGAAQTTYDLSDTILFGGGITITSAAIRNTLPGGITTNPAWNGTTVTSVVTGQNLAANGTHVYTVTVQAVVSTTITTEQGDCQLTTGETGTGFLNRATMTVDGASTSDEDCAPPGAKSNITIDKSLVSSTNTGGATWQISYDLTVTNTGAAGSYDLSDTLKYGAGITVDSATVANTAPGGITTNPAWNGTSVTQIVTGQAIAAGATHVYRVTTTATVSTTITTEAGDCELTTGETGTGFLNEAALTVDGQTTTDTDCSKPGTANVTIDKRVVSSTNTSGDTWQVNYDVTVTNTTDQATTYDLSDTLKFGGSIKVDSATVANTAPGGITTNPAWNGTSVTQIVTGQAIAANATHTYRVTATATVPATTTTAQADCTLDTGETGTGFLNRATVTTGGASQSDEDCAPPTTTGDKVTVDKRILSAENTGGDNWQVIYLVTVTNPGTGEVTYDLDDKIMFGQGITVTGQSVANTVPGSITTNPSWNGASDIRVVTGQSIAGRETQAYRVTVTATVPSTVTGAAADCQLTDGESGTGFLNRTTLTSDGVSQSDQDCAPPTSADAQVTVDKSLVSQVNTGGNAWTVTYDVTVRDTGTTATTYDLDDTLKFGAGITVDSATIANVSPGSITTNPSWNGVSNVRVVTGQPIEARATHVYRVTANATVATTTTTSSADCVLTTDESGTGFLNQAKVTAGGKTVVDEECGSPESDRKVTIDKRVATSTQTGDSGQWTVTYDITVTNSGSAADSYDLDDRLLFGTGITVNSATVANTAPGGITTNPSWNGTSDVRVVTAQSIAAAATHVYRVTAKATVAGTITAEAGDCTLTSTEAGTGFLNRASLTVNEVTTSDEDCTPPTTADSTVVVEKRLVASQRLTADGWQITYDVTVRNTGAATTYDLDDRIKFGDGITVTGQTIANTTPGSITTSPTWNGTSDVRVVTGQAIAANTTHVYRVTVTATVPATLTTAAADCTLGTDETGTGFLNEATVTSGGKTSTADACAPPQKPDTPLVSVDKSLISSTKTGDTTWQIVYDVTVRDSGSSATAYDLDDRLMFGAGITVGSATVVNTAPGSITTSPSWNGVSDVRVVTGRPIEAGATHVYRVTATATVATTVTTEAGDCNLLASETGTGFLNRTTLTANGGTMTDEACTPPTGNPPVTVDKTVVSSVQGSGNTWTIAYDIRVTNPGSAATTYDLDDRLLFGGSITVDSATVANTVPGGITTSPTWNGRTDIRVVTGTPIDAGASHVYRVTVTATVATTITTEQGDCELTSTESGTGFLNRATATAGGVSVTNTGCTSPNEPTVTIDKRAVSTTKVSERVWRVSYDITVTNTGTAPTTYDLDDRIRFGEGMTIDAATVANSAPGSITTNPSWNGVSDVRVVTGQAIAASAAHVYRVTVTATVPTTVTSTAGDCTLNTGETGTGFLNQATVTVNGSSQSDEDCTPPITDQPKISIDKSLVSATNTTGNIWQVVYDLTVTDSGAAGTYNLSDQLQFGAGITIDSAAVTNQVPGSISTNPAWNGTSVIGIVSGQAIAANATHVYRVTATATVPTTVTTTAADCELTTGETGTGFLNKATLVVGDQTTTDTGCATPGRTSVTIDKRLVSSTNTGGNAWQVLYDLTVTNSAGGPASYDLSDRLLFGGGITVESASVANTAPGSITTNPAWNGTSVIGIVSGQAIAASATHVYRVTVAATVATTITATAGDCQLVTGETGTGFLNRAALTVNGSTTTDEDCGSPPVTPPSPPRPPKPPRPPLPVTGAGVVGMATVGFGLLLAGAAALLVSRRRRSDMGE